MEKIIKTTRLQILFIIVLTVFVYINSLPNGLVWDDHLFVEKWKDMQNFDIVSLVKGSAPQAQGRLYRPVRSIIYAIDYKLWGQSPFFYHLQAILIHVGVTVLVYLVAKRLVFGGIREIRRMRGAGVIPFAAALLFATHPIHTETIDYISASLETFGSLFFFLSFYLYLRSPIHLRGVPQAQHHLGGGRRLGYLSYLSYLTAFLAFFTYEMTLTLPLLILLYEYFVGGISSSTKLRARGIGWVRGIRKVVPYFGIGGFYFITRTLTLGLLGRTDYLAYSFYHTMLTMVKVFSQYILLLFFPFNLTTNHRLVGDFPSSMLPYDKLDPILRQSIFDWDVLLGLLGILGLLGLAIKLYRKYPIVTFCIGWFFIALLPVSYIIPHGGAMAEKYLYIPSFGFVLILGLLFERIARTNFAKTQNSKVKSQNYGSTSSPSRAKSRDNSKLKTFGTIPLVISLCYFYLTIQRNTVWKNDITLFTDMERKAPNNLLATYTLGVLYGERNHFDIAESYYQRAINKAPDFWEAHFNLGNIYARVGKNDLAKKEYKKVLELNKDFVPAKNNLDLLTRHSGNQAKPEHPESPDAKRDSGVVATLLPRMTDSVDSQIKYSLKEISFEYPKNWSLKRDKSRVVINDGSFFTIEITLDKKKENVSANEYIAKTQESFGKLVNQGLAKVPEFDFAFVKVFDDRGLSKMQFFLFKKDLVIKVLVYPSDSPNMKQFDTILGSIKII